MSFDYITKVINPAWYFEYEPVREETDFDTEKAQRDIPSHLRQLMDTDEYRELPVKPIQGIQHLKSFCKRRADDFGGDTVRAISKHIDLKGKDWADLGAGSGFTLPLFRQAIGPNAKLWAGDLDVLTLDVLKYTSRGTNAVVFRNLPDDCKYRTQSHHCTDF